MLDDLDRGPVRDETYRGVSEQPRAARREKQLVKRATSALDGRLSLAELGGKRWRGSPRRERDLECLVFIPAAAPREKGPLNAYKQAVVRFPLSFPGHLCAPGRRLSSRLPFSVRSPPSRAPISRRQGESGL